MSQTEFPCTICGKYYSHQSTLSKHITVKHPEIREWKGEQFTGEPLFEVGTLDVNNYLRCMEEGNMHNVVVIPEIFQLPPDKISGLVNDIVNNNIRSAMIKVYGNNLHYDGRLVHCWDGNGTSSDYLSTTDIGFKLLMPIIHTVGEYIRQTYAHELRVPDEAYKFVLFEDRQRQQMALMNYTRNAVRDTLISKLNVILTNDFAKRPKYPRSKVTIGVKPNTKIECMV